jgi:hypothetical protein
VEHRTVTVYLLTTDGPLAFRVASIVSSTWNRVSGLQFEFVWAPPSDMRVSFAEGPSWSYVGTDCMYIAEPKPTMNLGIALTTQADTQRRVILHEFGHAAGFIHEHQSSSVALPWDREAVYAFYGAQGWDRETIDRQIFDGFGEWTDAGAYDSESIMHYAIPAELMLDRKARGGATVLSREDIAQAREWYGPAPAFDRLVETYLPIVRR